MVQASPEPKLEWATFGEFSARLNEGSGYRLVMDKSISDRPLVWYFSNPGESGFENLRRSCKELCLNFEVDEKFRKVFIVGPNADAGLLLRDKYEASLLESQKLTREYWSFSKDELETELLKVQMVSRGSKEPAGIARLLRLQIHLALMKRPEIRAMMLTISSVDAKQLANSLARNPSQEGMIAVPREAEQIFRSFYEVSRPGDEYGQMMWDGNQRRYDDINEDGGRLVCSVSGSNSGAVGVNVSMVGRTKKEILGAFSTQIPDWLKENLDPAVDVIPEKFLKEEYEDKQIAFWGVAGLNNWQTLAIKHKVNTVGWLEPYLPHKDLFNTLKDFSGLKPARMKVTDDGWMVPYEYGSRWKEFYGDWQGVINMTGKVTRAMDRELLAQYLVGVTDAEFDGMGAIQQVILEPEIRTLTVWGRLIRAALRESTVRGVKEFEVPVSELSDAAAADWRKQWLNLRPEWRLNPLAMRRLGFARIKLAERLYKEEEIVGVPDEQQLLIKVTVPLGTYNASGKEDVFEFTITVPIAEESQSFAFPM